MKGKGSVDMLLSPYSIAGGNSAPMVLVVEVYVFASMP